ncbi:MAG: hypothetical protein ACPL3C_11200 [Pyrobaculum sp.]
MWESWLYAVFKPPFNKRRPSAEPRRPPRFYAERCGAVEKPAAAARYVKLISTSLTGASACVAPAPIGDSSVKGTAPEAYVDKPPPPPIRQLRSRGVSIPRVDAPELSSRKYTRIPGYIV